MSAIIALHDYVFIIYVILCIAGHAAGDKALAYD
jgi:hypothetical protein